MKIVQVNIAATEVMLFTPLPQLHMANVLLDNQICSEKEIVTLEYINSEALSKIFFEVAKHKPDIVAFSAYMWNIKLVDQLSESIKSWSDNKCWVVWGGPHVSEDPLYFLKKHKKSVDFLVTWYGERPIIQITKSWKDSKGNLSSAKENLINQKVKGIYFNGEFKNNLLSKSEEESLMVLQKKQNHGNTVEESPRYNQFGGDAYGLRAGDFIPITELPEAYQYKRLPQHIKDNISERVFMLESYRGCPFSCSYCLWGVAQKKCDYLSVDRMNLEFENMVNFGVRHFNLADAGFGLKKERDISFLKNIIEIQSQIKHKINLSGYWFWQTLNDEMLEVMKEVVSKGIMGQVDVGIQTFNPTVTKLMKRPTNFEKFNETMVRLKNHKLPFQMDLILGLPGDDYKGYLNSVENVMRIQPDKFQTFPLSILPGSDYDKRREELGIKTMKGSRTMEIDSIIETKSFPSTEIQKALRVESYFYLTYTLRIINNTLRHLAKVTETSFFEVSINLFEQTSNDDNIIFQLTGQYFKELYENRHLGRTLLDNFLFKNFDSIHKELKKCFLVYLKKHNKVNLKEDIFELLAYDLLIFPKLYSTIEKTKSFDKILEEFNPKKKSIIANFSSKIILEKFFPNQQCNEKIFRISFTEPKSNFREGGIATQYNFWKWSTAIEPKLSIAV